MLKQIILLFLLTKSHGHSNSSNLRSLKTPLDEILNNVFDKHSGPNKNENEKRKNDVPTDAICLYQSHFNKGTKIIDVGGKYKLCEDITFFPQVNAPTDEYLPENAFEPIFPSTVYNENKYNLGFFAALVIETSDFEFYLNGFTIEQSKEHALLQRFFSVIELANSPFIDDTGPADFIIGDSSRRDRPFQDDPFYQFESASQVSIFGPGTIGRSSHHGIHGNDNVDVIIENVNFIDFEVAAISLNNVDNLRIENCTIERNRKDVPVLGMFSAAKFIRGYGEKLVELDYSMNLRGVEVRAEELYENLVKAIENVYFDVIKNGVIDKDTHKEEYDLFHNTNSVVDGPCYGFLIHGKGPAVGDFALELEYAHARTSSNIAIRNNIIENITCWTNEVPAIVEEDEVMNDARGAVLQLIRSEDKSLIAINEDGTYKGNVVADMQIMVAKAIHDEVLNDTYVLQTSVNTINSTIVGWAESDSAIYNPRYRCNGDSMHHFNKGIMAIRVEDTIGFDISGNRIANIENLSLEPFDQCTDYHDGANNPNDSEREAANIRGLSIGAVTRFSSTTSSELLPPSLPTSTNLPLPFQDLIKIVFPFVGESGQSTCHLCSQIHRNEVFNFKSENGLGLGMSIYGFSEFIHIDQNIINLNDKAVKSDSDRFIALRVEKYSIFKEDFSDSDTIEIACNNNFQQEIEERFVELDSSVLEDDDEARRNKRILCPVTGMSLSTVPNSNRPNEWLLGRSPGKGASCPFGSNRGT